MEQICMLGRWFHPDHTFRSKQISSALHHKIHPPNQSGDLAPKPDNNSTYNGYKWGQIGKPNRLATNRDHRSRCSTPTQLDVLYLNRSPKSTAIPLQKHGTTPNTTFKILKSRKSMPLCMPGRLDRDNSSDTRNIARICRAKITTSSTGPGPGLKSASPAGISRIELERSHKLRRDYLEAAS